MTKQQIKDYIKDIIENAAGPITADAIYGSLIDQVNPGRTQETIRKYIREMVNSGNYLIGSSNRGYYKISTKKQVVDSLRYLEGRIPDLQKRAKAIKTNWNENNPLDKI